MYMHATWFHRPMLSVTDTSVGAPIKGGKKEKFDNH